MPDVSRSDSQRSDSSQRPRVSFNRDVRIKRIGRPEGSVVPAVTSDGEGNLVPTAVRRERGQSSRAQSAREAAIVLKHADSVNCIPVLDTSLRKTTIPKRNTKDTLNRIKTNDTSRKKLTRSVSDAGGRYAHDRNKYLGGDLGQGKTYWSENEGEEDSASSEGGRQKYRKQDEKKINIFATLNNRLRGKKKKKNIDSEPIDGRPNTTTDSSKLNDIASNLKSKSKSIEDLPEVRGSEEKKSQLTQTSTLPRRSKHSKKQLSPIIEDEPIVNTPRSPFDFSNQEKSTRSKMYNIGNPSNVNVAPKITIEPPTPVYEVEEKRFTPSKGSSDRGLKKENRKPSVLMESSGKDSRSSLREEDDARRLLDKDEREIIESERDHRRIPHERFDGRQIEAGKLDDVNTRFIKSEKKSRTKPKEITKSRSRFYDNEDLSSEEDFGLAHDNGHYKSYDYGLLDPDLSISNIEDVTLNKKTELDRQVEGLDEYRRNDGFHKTKSKKIARKAEEVNEVKNVPKTFEEVFMDPGTVRLKKRVEKNRKSGKNSRGNEGKGKDISSKLIEHQENQNAKKSMLKSTSMSPESRLFPEENSMVGLQFLNAHDAIKRKDDDLFRGENRLREDSNQGDRNNSPRKLFGDERRGSSHSENSKLNTNQGTETIGARKLVTSDEEERPSRKTVGMLVEELSRKQSAKKRKESFQADKSKKLGPLIDPLLDLDRRHNNNQPFSYTDPYKSPPPLLGSVSVDAKQLETPTDEVIYAEVICTPAGKVGGDVGVGGNSSFLARAGHPSTHEAGLAGTNEHNNTEFGVSREPSVEPATSVIPQRSIVHKVRKSPQTTQSAQPRSQKTTVHTIVKRTNNNAGASGVSTVKLNEKVNPDASDHTIINSYLTKEQFSVDSNANQNSNNQGSTVELNGITIHNTNTYNPYTLSSIPNNDSNQNSFDRLETDPGNISNFNISEIDTTIKFTKDSQQFKSEKITTKKSSGNFSEGFRVDVSGNNSSSNGGKNVITEKEYFVDDYCYSPIEEETREASSFREESRHLQSSPQLYLSKSERDLSKIDASLIREGESIEKRESIIRVDVEREDIGKDLQDSIVSKSSKMNTTQSVSTEKLLSGELNDLSLRRHRLESIIDSHKRRFENRAVSPNRYSRTLTRSISNVSPSYRRNSYIEDDLSNATKKTIKEDRYFERHIKRTASNFKDKDLLSDGAPLKIEGDRNTRNNYKTYNYYLKNDTKNNEKFNNEYNLTNSIRDNKYRSSDNVAEIYRNEEVNNENNGAKYGKKHFREWYTSTSVKKTERGSGDDTSYGYGSVKGDAEVHKIKDEGRNIKVTRSDSRNGRDDSSRVAIDDVKNNRKNESGRGSKGGFFDKLRNEQKTSKTSSVMEPNSRKVSGLEKVRRKLSNWNSGKKKSVQDKGEKKDKKKKGKDEKLQGSKVEEQKDPLTSRYSEYRGEESAGDDGGESDYYATRQRVSTPETDPSWFRSLDRIKHKSSHSPSSRFSGEDTVDRKHRPVSRANSTSQKNLRFFGESDSGSYPSLNTSHLQVPSNRTSSRLRSSLDSSAESTLEEDSGHSQKSVVYLHAATVGDIPGSRKLHRSQITSGRRSMSREELSSNKTDSTFVPHKRNLSRSISVLAPWRPRHPREGIEVNYNDAGKPPRAPIKINNRTLTRLQQQESKKRSMYSSGDTGRDSRSDRRGSDESRSTGVSDSSTANPRRRRDVAGSETDLARSKSVPRSSKLSSGWFRGK